MSGIDELTGVLTADIAEVKAQEHQIDCFVIGSGTAGVTCALELAAQGRRVVILEAGPVVLTQHVGSSPLGTRGDLVEALHKKISYRTTWAPAEEIETAAAEIDQWSLAGGRTLLWGGCTPRFFPSDFETWPFDYDEFEPYYKKAEQLLHVSGCEGGLPPFCQGPEHDRVLGLLKEAGLPARHAPLAVDTRAPRNGVIPGGFESSLPRLLRDPLFQDKVSLVTECPVVSLKREGDRIASVEVFHKPTGRRYDLSAQHVVLACGAMQSTYLALRSGLDSGNDMVGRYVGDHLLLGGALRLEEGLPEKPLYVLIDPDSERLFQVQLEGPFTELRMPKIHTTSWLNLPDDGRLLLCACFGIASVERDNRLVLQESHDPAEIAGYKVIYDRSEHDQRVLDSIPPFLSKLGDLLGAEFLGSRAEKPGNALHEFGGLRTGNDPQESVVNPWGRFHHLENLWAADASVFPFQGSANSYLSITAWSLRCAGGILSH